MNIVLIGPPGSGKGTQGERVATKLGLDHIAMGDLLRAEIAAGTELGGQIAAYVERGDLVPDDLILGLITPRILDAVAGNGYLLDGFPRSVPQAREARRFAEELGASADLAVYLDVPHDVLVQRLLERARVEGRADDTPEVIENRLAVFEEATHPLVDYYRGRGLLESVDADRPLEEVTVDIIRLAEARGTPAQRRSP